MIKRKFGALPSPPDPRDYRFADIGGAAIKPQPYHSDVKDIIVNQLDSMQCGACALAAARYEREYRQNGNTRELSHTFAYGSDYDLSSEGMYARTVAKIGATGIPYATDWESWGDKQTCRKLVKRNTTDKLTEEAHKLRCSRYYRCNSWTEVCNAVRATNGGVILLVAVYEKWYGVGSDGVVGKNKGQYCGGHFVRVKDYELLPSGNVILRCQNSWGEDWGDGGYCYLYSDINTFVEAWALVDDVDEVVRRLFEDVAEDSWAREAIEYCAKNGILSGFEDGTFRPGENVTREQAAMIAYQILKKLEGSNA